ncbi:MAG: magnesium transporter [Alkalispirochaetaceae bacterium]
MMLDNLREYMSYMSDAELRKVVEDLSTHEILEAWDSLSQEEAAKLFLLFPLEKKVELITELSLSDQEWLIKSLPLANIREIFDEVDPDDLVDIIQELKPEVRESVWQSLSDEAKQETQFLLRFDADDAAGLMTTRHVAIRANITVGQALAFIRINARDVETIYYVYVVDALKRLQGVVSLRDLLFVDDSERIADVMVKQVISVSEDTDQEEVAKLLSTYDLIALPVVDSYNRLLGIVTFDDVFDVIQDEQTEDVYKMSSMEGGVHPYTDSSVWRLMKKRVPWLVVLLIAGTFTTNVINAFEPIIAAAGFLVWFVPVITQTGGNSGTQSSTLMIRGIATGEIHFRDFAKILLKEALVGLLMGVILAVVIILRGIFLPPGVLPEQAVAIGAALLFVVIFSSVIGAFAPLVIHRLGFDPTVMAGPLMATVIDVAGLTIYFEAARFILGL